MDEELKRRRNAVLLLKNFKIFNYLWQWYQYTLCHCINILILSKPTIKSSFAWVQLKVFVHRSFLFLPHIAILLSLKTYWTKRTSLLLDIIFSIFTPLYMSSGQ